MAITIEITEVANVNRQRCLRGTDIHSITEVAQEMRNASDESELLSIARRMLNQDKRNVRAGHNENNVQTFKDKICRLTHHGDMLTAGSASELLYDEDRELDHEGATWFALLAALDDLVDEGYLKRTVMRNFTRGANGSHIEVYTVIAD